MQMVVSEPAEKLRESRTWDGPIHSGTLPSASGIPGPNKKVIPTPIVTSPSPPQTLSPTGSLLTVNTPTTGGCLGGGLYDKNARFRRSSAVHLVATASGSCKKYRSKSVVSVDPQSPYYSARGAAAGNANANGGFVTHGLHKAPTVSCVPGYDAKASNVSRTGDPLADGLKRKASEAKNGQIPGLNLGLSPNDPKTSTIRQHYYPEGGWGWVICACALLVQLLTCGLHYSYGYLIVDLVAKFKTDSSLMEGVCLGALSTSVALFFSPVVVAICRRKSTRLLAVLGGLVSALGCLFTSFASQFHQLYLSYGIIVGVGVCITRDTSSLMVGQYFKKRREIVEIIISLGTGLGLSVMPLFLKECTSSIGWRLGLQAVTGLVFVTFILGVFYRPASLYHPQRRAILHLKSLQKRSKAKDKSAQHDKPPFFDFGVLKSRTVQILVCGVGLTAFGSHAPVMLLIYEGHKEGFSPHSLQLLQIFLGVAFTLGSGAFGFIVVKKSVQCMIARQYLFQAASFMLAASLLAFTALDAYNGYVLFVWIYGIFYGGYQYSLKMYTFEKVRARNFPRAWGFVQCSQAIPNLVGVPLTCYLNEKYGVKTGFYFASAFVFMGSLSLFLIDAHKKKLQRRKLSLLSDGRRCSDACFSRTFSRRSSFQDSIFGRNPQLTRTQQRSLTFSNYADLRRQELTCISEEVVMDNFMEDFMDDCITSCNREEKYLMLSEFENNLTKTHEVEGPTTKRTFFRPFKRVSVLSKPTPPNHCPNCMRHLPDIRSADMIIEEESGLRMSATEQTLAPAVANLVANAIKNNNIVNSIPVDEDETREVTTMV